MGTAATLPGTAATAAVPERHEPCCDKSVVRDPARLNALSSGR
jgi:hypothetical protein